MPVIQKIDSVGANATAFPLTGSVYEYLPFPAHVEIALIQQSGSVGDVLGTVNSGSDVLQEEGPITQKAGSAVYPDDYNLSDEAAMGDRLRVALRNTTAGAINVLTTVKITPMA